MEQGSPRHILYLSRWYPSKTDPMFGLFVRKHALAAVDAGFRVTVVFVLPGTVDDRRKVFQASASTEGLLTEITVTYRKSDGIPGIARQLIAWNLGVRMAVQLFGKPQLIHAHVLTRTALLAWYYGRKWNIPYLITEHWSRYYSENFQFTGFLRKWLTRFAVRNAALTTVVSSKLAESMKRAGVGNNLPLFPNLVDTKLFNISKEKSSKLSIISISCFEEKSKNLKLLIDAFANLQSDKYTPELVLVGDGADLGLIRKYAFEKILPPKRYRFTGVLTGDALAKELQQASCLALSSNYETFGIVAYESMACGVPVVATDVADLAGFIKPDAGRVVPTGDVLAFSEALNEVLSNPDKFDSLAMRSRVEAQNGPEAVSARIKSLYNSLINTKQ